MHCEVTLKGDEFKRIHNGLYDLDSVINLLEDVLKPELYKKLSKATKEIRVGLKGAYEQEAEDSRCKYKHYSNVAEDLGIKNSTWSIYEVDNLSDRHPYTADTLVYRDHWGNKPVEKSINGLTWAALFVAADACIRDSGDEHHTYIERFVAEHDNKGRTVLVLQTGS